jgi:hypothetical protein
MTQRQLAQLLVELRNMMAVTILAHILLLVRIVSGMASPSARALALARKSQYILPLLAT